MPRPDRSSGGPADLTLQLRELARGGAGPSAEAMAFVVAELERVARGNLRSERPDHTLQASALINEAYLRLFGGTSGGWNDRRHFFTAAAKTMRRILVDHARARKAQKRGGRNLKVTLSEELAGAAIGFDVLDLHLAMLDLAEESQEMARIVELRYFGGLEMDEVAEAMQLSKSTVERRWRSARAWLGVRLQSGGTR